MSLIVQASRKANEYSLTHKENKMFNRSIEALRLNVAPSTTSGGGDSSGTPSHLHPHHHHLKIPGSGSNTMSCSTPIIDNKSEICVEPNHNRNTHETPNRSYSYRIFTKLIKMAFSTVGLIGVVFLYSTLGALMFQLLEQHEELRLCEGPDFNTFSVFGHKFDSIYRRERKIRERGQTMSRKNPPIRDLQLNERSPNPRQSDPKDTFRVGPAIRTIGASRRRRLHHRQLLPREFLGHHVPAAHIASLNRQQRTISVH